jgi:uncharacterized oligopeptide transporter (OPT) family protein
MTTNQETSSDPASTHQPFVPDDKIIPESTWPTIVVGVILGIIFGASSLYLVLKVGLTVSASVPIAVLSITLFRAFSKTFGIRRTTILENNIVQTTGSAGESIAFGVGVTMPALFLLGFEMEPVRVMTVAVLGGLLGILMMIPLRRAFIVKQHGKLVYPEGTACAEVLIAGEKGGASARMVFVGFGIAGLYKFLMDGMKFWSSEPGAKLYATSEAGKTTGLKGAGVGGELSPELLGVGYLIGPRIASLMIAGAILSYLVIGPLIATFGEQATQPVSPAKWEQQSDPPRDMMVGAAGGIAWSMENDPGLIHNMGPDELKANYLKYVGAGAVAVGGIISLGRALPLILASILAGLRDLRSSGSRRNVGPRRTERDLPMWLVLLGCIGLVVILAAVPQLGLGLSLQGLMGAAMILLFGFLFVTVSSRLTGEIGSSSNPISGMTIATLLLTCVIFVIAKHTSHAAMLMALMVAAVVCIASSNGGTTSQDLKTGYLVGATPSKQQIGILIGAISSAIVIGFTMLILNEAWTHYTNKNLPIRQLIILPGAPIQKPGKPHNIKGWDGYDDNDYFVVFVSKSDPINNPDRFPDVKPGRYLVDSAGWIKYRTDLPVSRESKEMDNNEKAPRPFGAPQPGLFANIISGILQGTLEWGLVILGGLIAISLEFAGISALPFAVGMYLPFSSSAPIFIGGMVRLVVDKLRGKPASEAEAETSSGVLLSSGFIAGGTLMGVVLAFLEFDASIKDALALGPSLWEKLKLGADATKIASLIMFGLLIIALIVVGSRKNKAVVARE